MMVHVGSSTSPTRMPACRPSAMSSPTSGFWVPEAFHGLPLTSLRFYAEKFLWRHSHRDSDATSELLANWPRGILRVAGSNERSSFRNRSLPYRPSPAPASTHPATMKHLREHITRCLCFDASNVSLCIKSEIRLSLACLPGMILHYRQGVPIGACLRRGCQRVAILDLRRHGYMAYNSRDSM